MFCSCQISNSQPQALAAIRQKIEILSAEFNTIFATSKAALIACSAASALIPSDVSETKSGSARAAVDRNGKRSRTGDWIGGELLADAANRATPFWQRNMR